MQRLLREQHAPLLQERHLRCPRLEIWRKNGDWDRDEGL